MRINKEAECEVVKEKLKKTQKDWIKYFNNKNLKMISAPDIYKATKKDIIESLKEDFEESWVVTNTRIVYNKDNLNTQIIHNADSKVIKPKIYNVKVPELNEELKQDSETEKYLQALFDTKDNIAKILRTLKKYSKGKKVYLWTSTQSSRKDKQVRCVVFLFDFGRFVVGGDDWFVNYVGCSRRVVIDSAKQSKRGKRK